MRWIGVSVAALSFVFAAGAAIADHQGGASGGGEGVGSGGRVRPSSTIPGFHLVVRNRCSQTIAIAHRVKDYTGLWVTRGWFHISPRRTKTLSMPTRNTIFYYYGYTVRGNKWSGTGKPGSIRRWVRTKAFMHSSGNLSGRGARLVSFRKRVVPSTGFFRLNLSCSGG